MSIGRIMPGLGAGAPVREKIASMTETFAAFTAEKTDDGYRRGVTELTLDDLPADDVVVDVEWSSVNYKDHLAATEKGRCGSHLTDRARHRPGGHGAIERCRGVAEGEQVIVHGYDLGVAHHGGYAQVARVPAEWVVPLPTASRRGRR